ncbi:PREDICTED: protein SGT1 homolog [Priapulus caudatus]|uniref:Protein SGT1 homolog n=1 Tax=Priapulus caudatus TaxID=37621 RepID=A0ABM1EK22_PRICU|nr:PREDICTED: protein SGT1 homolog [Priapulus caudatus]
MGAEFPAEEAEDAEAAVAEVDLVLALAHDVVPEQSTFRVMATKVELKMKRLEGLRWEALEAARDDTDAKQFKPAESRHGDDNDPAAAHRYPSASGRDWDKVARDMDRKEKDTKEEGEAALNQLFQQIYGEGSEEVKKAMNKSFVESGGTVLSTNWGEVGTKKIDVKPPDGMEYRKWDQ